MYFFISHILFSSLEVWVLLTFFFSLMMFMLSSTFLNMKGVLMIVVQNVLVTFLGLSLLIDFSLGCVSYFSPLLTW